MPLPAAVHSTVSRSCFNIGMPSFLGCLSFTARFTPGKLAEKVTYKDGKKTGSWVRYGQNGKVTTAAIKQEE